MLSIFGEIILGTTIPKFVMYILPHINKKLEKIFKNHDYFFLLYRNFQIWRAAE